MPLAVLYCLALLAPAAPPDVAGLAQRLEGEGSQQCWEAVVDIKSCTGEIILFLLNGEAYLGPGCCRAIRDIEHSCSAADAMLSRHRVHPRGGGHAQGLLRRGRQRRLAATPARESVAAVAGRKSASAHR
ncbi:hypothetical protein PVAP13_9KG475200 [Panicum virgatum]|uniref:Prolamin-like domain-containing protein n=1 Tax=Panicum virgatum TaxID=38727 RepID=A0A8T0NU03_PANVG|nr:hypothetical protein PVAP13_9KG475200 [Panicum virgatum]